jgi:hypothetical protein
MPDFRMQECLLYAKDHWNRRRPERPSGSKSAPAVRDIPQAEAGMTHPASLSMTRFAGLVARCNGSD